MKVALYTAAGVAGGLIIFKLFEATGEISWLIFTPKANPLPKTISKEWKEASEKKMIEKKMNPMSHST